MTQWILRKKKGVPNERNEGTRTRTQTTVLDRSMSLPKTLSRKKQRGEAVTLVNRNQKLNGERKGKRRKSSRHPHLARERTRNQNGRRENLSCRTYPTLLQKTITGNPGRPNF